MPWWDAWVELDEEVTEDAAGYCPRCGSLMEQPGSCEFCLFIQGSCAWEAMLLEGQIEYEPEGARHLQGDVAA